MKDSIFPQNLSSFMNMSQEELFCEETDRYCGWSAQKSWKKKPQQFNFKKKQTIQEENNFEKKSQNKSWPSLQTWRFFRKTAILSKVKNKIRIIKLKPMSNKYDNSVSSVSVNDEEESKNSIINKSMSSSETSQCSQYYEKRNEHKSVISEDQDLIF